MEYLRLADVVAIAAAVLRLEPEVLLRASHLNMADSAVHAPKASFGGVEFHPGLARRYDSSEALRGLWLDFVASRPPESEDDPYVTLGQQTQPCTMSTMP